MKEQVETHSYITVKLIKILFLNIGELDSALYYTELAFNKLPGNVVHFGNYAVTLAALKDSLS